MVAAQNGNVGQISTLLNRGADINAVSNLGYTALMFAAQENKREVVEVLLNRGARTDIRESGGFTASEIVAYTNPGLAARIDAVTRQRAAAPSTKVARSPASILPPVKSNSRD